MRDEVAELVADDLLDGVLSEAEIAQRVQRPAALFIPEFAFRENQSYEYEIDAEALVLYGY